MHQKAVTIKVNYFLYKFWLSQVTASLSFKVDGTAKQLQDKLIDNAVVSCVKNSALKKH